MKRYAGSLQRDACALARRGARTTSHLIGLLLLSLLLFQASIARAQTTELSIVLTGGSGWNTMPFAQFDSTGYLDYYNPSVGNPFANWAATSGVQVLVGDFNGDGLSDIALVGIPGEDVVAVALNNSDGTFTPYLFSVPGFASWMATPGVRVLVGDFNGDGHADIALAGGKGWNTVPVAFFNNGFTVTNLPVGAFASFAATPGVQVLVGDFNGDGKSDIALTGGAGWASVPVAFSNGDGTFKITNDTVTNSSPGDFARMAATPGAHALVADFNQDGKADIALVGGTNWASVPVAFSNGDGTFKITNATVTNSSPGDFARWAAAPGARALVGVFVGVLDPFGGNTVAGVDIALVGGSGWNTLPVAHSNGDGTFTVTNKPVGAWFQASAAAPGAQVLVGDFNRDGLADIALVGGAGWNTAPLAFSLGGGNFNAVNEPAGDFAAWAAQPGVKALAAVVRTAAADVAIQKQFVLIPPTSTSLFGYQVQVSNNGPEDAFNVVLNSSVPVASGAFWITSQGSCKATRWNDEAVQCNLGSMPKGSTAWVQIFAYSWFSQGEVESTTATVSASTFDPNLGNNSSTLYMTVQ